MFKHGGSHHLNIVDYIDTWLVIYAYQKVCVKSQIKCKVLTKRTREFR